MPDSISRKEQINKLMENNVFLEQLYKNFENYINSIDWTNRSDEETLRTISTTINNKSSYFNRVFQPFKRPFQSSFVENNETLNEPFYPAYGLYPFKHEIYSTWTNSTVSNKINIHLNSFCLNHHSNYSHYQCVKVFKKFLYFK